ncbi:hypothetical protein CcI156_21955 [Frankia sp. CcI156]|uniref:Membrane protein n=3 Tax=Frankia TaxID=1854 RepID=Q2J6K6_FRACC|nr:putative membrane protein [Frankia casuarinae]ESZ99975.1 putative membrane protein [Frankia sp. CcI6]KDA41799.1 putative membrane protein [Frankia sp. BMG5.23]KFB06245.1 putative membrane protein [Frankia sp. Allo2]OFB41821.1 hypothetical protein Manayef4_16615 [Frankia sp. CgIM4]OHV52140.1 hypothetical protein CgIS1_17415 [Frankia sp. CgIS1]ONH22168.1 hypothetical protein CcI156_21955 [Frankia sp. CcI156]ORT50658.1 hypothetical protein KBI5_13210 [Frankia sp. KB5]
MARMNWELRTCARKGHVTYRPDETSLAERLTARTAVGVSWRCLRCGDFVVGEPALSGPAEDAPLLLRGRALRDATVLRLLAVERILRALLMVLIGYAILRFRRSEGQLQQLFDRAVPAARPLADVLRLDLDHSPTIDRLHHLLHTRPHTLLLVALLLFGYAAVQVVEGIGLWLLKRWGEYFAAVATSAFLPLEIYELTERITVLRIGALVINVGAVVYLIVSKRLFRVRGGAAAFEAERHAESLLEVEHSAQADPARPDPAVPQDPRPQAFT